MIIPRGALRGPQRLKTYLECTSSVVLAYRRRTLQDQYEPLDVEGCRLSQTVSIRAHLE